MQPDEAPSHGLSGEELTRRRIERSIVVAMIIVPFLIWIVSSGIGRTVITATFDRLLGSMAWPSYVVMQILTTATLLLSWRCPLRRRSLWQPVSVVVAAFTLPTLGFLAANFWMDPTRDLSRLARAGLVNFLEWGLILAGALMVFVLVRRATGICLIHESTTNIPERKKLSIAELLGWTAALAMFLALAPIVIAETYWSQAGTSAAYYSYLLTRIAITALSTLSVVATVHWRWAIRIPVAIVAVIILHLVEPIVYSIVYSLPLGSWFQILFMPTTSAVLILVVVWCVERLGYRYVRLGGWVPVS